MLRPVSSWERCEVWPGGRREADCGLGSGPGEERSGTGGGTVTTLQRPGHYSQTRQDHQGQHAPPPTIAYRNTGIRCSSRSGHSKITVPGGKLEGRRGQEYVIDKNFHYILSFLMSFLICPLPLCGCCHSDVQRQTAPEVPSLDGISVATTRLMCSLVPSKR